MLRKIMKSAFARYVIVGVVSVGVDYGLLLLGYHVVGVSLVAATTTGFIVGMFVNFLLNKLWAFGDTERNVKRSTWQFLLYGTLTAFNLVFTNLFVVYLREINIGPEISKLICTAIITLWNFVLYKKVIFKQKTMQQEPTTPLS